MVYIRALAELIPLLVTLVKKVIEASDAMKDFYIERKAHLAWEKAEIKARVTKDTSDLEKLWGGGPPRT